MRLAYAVLALSAYLVLLLVIPFFDPGGFTPAYRLLLLVLSIALMVGAGGFIYSFAPSPVPELEETYE